MNPTPPSATIPNTTTLEAIQIKVRRLTRAMSESALSTTDLNNYINTFVVYDFPEHLRTFNLRTTFSFYTNPGQDTYNTDIASFGASPSAENNPLYNFQNKYLTVMPPIFIAGYQSLFSESQTQFFSIYPKLNSIASIGVTGDGATTTFTGVVNTQQSQIPNSNFVQNVGLLQGEVLFSSIDVGGIGLTLVDVPVIDPTTGFKSLEGNLYDPNSAAYQAALLNPPTAVLIGNNINYLTGAFTITFSSAPASGVQINSQTVPQAWSLPQSVLFYSNKFIVRPVPDQPYKINFEVYQRPTALMAEQSPELEEYWQYIAYGAARKVFQDRMDLDSVAMLEPEYKKQETLCLRRTIVQQTSQRTPSIYQEQSNAAGAYGPGWFGNAGLL